MSSVGFIWHLSGRPVGEGSIDRLMNAVSHRNPKGHTQQVDGAVAIGQGLRAADAPSTSTHRSNAMDDLAVAFDGRLDNRPALETALSAVGIGATDTALLALAYRRWGADIAQHLLGDFTLIVWDARLQRAVCARDHVGIRVLHYYYDGEHFMAASEIKQLLTQPGVGSELNLDQLRRFLLLREGQSDETCYRHISRLPAGHTLVVDRDGIHVLPFWQFEPSPDRKARPHQEYEEGLRAVLQEAVRCRMPASGPTGFMVSGGMDSTSVYAMARRLTVDGLAESGPLHTLSWAFPSLPKMDESRYARALVGAPSQQAHYIDGSELWSMKEAESPLAGRDEPYVAPHEALLRETLRQAQGHGIGVLMTGQGGEVCDIGMPYLADLTLGLEWRRLWQVLHLLSRRRKIALSRSIVAETLPRPFARFLGRRPNLPPPQWIHSDAGHRRNAELRVRPGRHRRERAMMAKSVLSTGSSPWTLWADQTGAEYGMELRHPFWDVRLIEYLGSVPPEANFHPVWSKYLLRRAMNESLPREVCWRRAKTTFYPLFDLGITQREGPRLARLTQDMRLADLGLVEPKVLEAAFEQYRQGHTLFRDYFWATFVTEEWLRTQSDDAPRVKLMEGSSPVQL